MAESSAGGNEDYQLGDGTNEPRLQRSRNAQQNTDIVEMAVGAGTLAP